MRETNIDEISHFIVLEYTFPDTGKVSLLFLSVCKTGGDRLVKTQQDRTKNKRTHTHTLFLAEAFVSDSQLHTSRAALYL